MRMNRSANAVSWIMPVCFGLAMHASLHAQQIVAHRGASHVAPENTIAAFRQAWREGADAIEGDFHLTKDGNIVCIHDADTKRTAGVSRSVANSTLEDLSRLDVGRWKDAAYTGERIPTLEQVLETVPANKRIFIEIKCGPEIVPALRKVLSQTRLAPSQIAVIAFQAEVIKASKAALPHIKAYWLTGYKRKGVLKNWSPKTETVLETLRRIKADGLDSQFNPEVLTAQFVQQLRGAGLEFHCWTVDDASAANQLRALGVDSITTNRPEWIRRNMVSRDLYSLLDVYLPLDGKLIDASAHRRKVGVLASHKSSGERASLQYRDAVFGQGIELSRKDRIPVVEYRMPSKGSICLWYYARDWYNYQTIVDNLADENAWEFWIYKTGQAKFRINPGGAVVAHQFHRTGDVNEWHHLAITWDRDDKSNQAFKLYVNGRLSDAVSWKSAHWTTPGQQFYLGGGHSGNSIGKGIWDDVGVFKTVLSQAEVRHLMYVGIGSLKSNAKSP
jgi:glycerophosphoryl diester phosphodiesterase